MKRHEYVGYNIKAAMVKRGITPAEMADRMEICLVTWYRRMRRPEELSLRELDLAAAALKIPVEELLKKGA